MGIKATIQRHELALGSRRFIQGLVGNNSEYNSKQPPKGSAVYVAIDGTYRGFFQFRNRIREGVPELLERLSSGFDLHLLSGDNETEKNRFTGISSAWKSLSFNQSPSDKLEAIRSLKRDGHKVVMIGDGLNDAGALKASNFGIAISDDMSSFSPACDAIIEADAIDNIDKLIGFSHTAFRIILGSFALSLLYNLTGLGFAITGHLSPLVAAILMPLSSVSVMAFTNISTRVKAKRQGLKIWA
jgi:Cu+-exporting ATPase